VMPGDNLKFNVDLIAPIAMEQRLRSPVRDGGRTVGAGRFRNHLADAADSEQYAGHCAQLS